MPGWLKNLFAGYPALVMATGIIAVACEQQGLGPAAEALYAITAFAYVALAVLIGLRIAFFPRAVVDDFRHPEKSFTFLTLVAATNVLGSASAVVHGWWGLAWVLWWVSLPLLAVCLYVPLITAILERRAPDLGRGINGTWFLMTVAIQSVAVLAALLLAHSQHDLLAFVSLAAFGIGLVLYVTVMTLIFARWTLTRVDPTEIHPPAWIAAGAVAITTLAGSNMITAASASERLQLLLPYLEGMTVLAWATATFWFPVMVAVGLWRHLYRRVPLTYDPAFWAMVFPLGMYSAATFVMLGAIDLEHLDFLPKVALAIAGITWLATTTGLLRHLLRRPARRAGAD